MPPLPTSLTLCVFVGIHISDLTLLFYVLLLLNVMRWNQINWTWTWKDGPKDPRFTTLSLKDPIIFDLSPKDPPFFVAPFIERPLCLRCLVALVPHSDIWVPPGSLPLTIHVQSCEFQLGLLGLKKVYYFACFCQHVLFSFTSFTGANEMIHKVL